jgi:ABC-2 type transport system ATP-binding protein
MESIIVDSVTKIYGSRKAVDNLSFKVKKGSIHGFLGPNGAGKTTTMKMIAGVIPPAHGNIYINGNNVQENLLKVKASLGVLLENPPLYKDMEVRDYLRYVCQLHKVEKSKINDYLDYAIEKLDLKDVEFRLIGNLSKGYKQRVGVAQAIVNKPDIVILDEPTVGLDPSSVIEMRDLIKELAKEHTVLLSSHLLHEISLICDEVTIIKDGLLQATGPVEQIAQKVKDKEKLIVKVRKWDSSLNQEFSKLASYKIEQVEEGFQLSIDQKIGEDSRDEIAKFVIKNDLGLLELNKESLDLEKVFLEVTGGKYD